MRYLCDIVVDLLQLYSQPLVKDAQVKLIDLVYDMISDGNLKFAQLLRNALVDKVHLTVKLILSKSDLLSMYSSGICLECEVHGGEHGNDVVWYGMVGSTGISLPEVDFPSLSKVDAHV